MITQAPTSADLLATAAAAAAATLGGLTPLSVGPIGKDAEQAGFGTEAVLVPFSGPFTGDLLIVASPELSTALAEADGGSLDLAAALGPAFAAIAAAIGPVVLGTAQLVDARLGLSRIMATADAALVPLLSGEDQPRVAVALSVHAPASAMTNGTTNQMTNGAGLDAGVAHERLELLRGVAMEATVELGRARMTVNELLALRPGTVVELDQAAGTPADLVVNGRLIARGEVVVVDENYGLRITHVVTDASER